MNECIHGIAHYLGKVTRHVLFNPVRAAKRERASECANNDWLPLLFGRLLVSSGLQDNNSFIHSFFNPKNIPLRRAFTFLIGFCDKTLSMGELRITLWKRLHAFLFAFKSSSSALHFYFLPAWWGIFLCIKLLSCCSVCTAKPFVECYYDSVYTFMCLCLHEGHWHSCRWCKTE